MKGDRSAGKVVRASTQLYRKHFLIVLLISIIVYGSSRLLGLAGGYFENWIGLSTQGMRSIINVSVILYWAAYLMTFAVTFAFGIPSGMLQASANGVLLGLSFGKKTGLRDVAKNFRKNWLRYLGVSAWATLWYFLWLLVFVIPGIIKYFGYLFAPYLVLEYPDMTVRQALKKSMEISNGYKRRLFAAGFWIELPYIVTLIVAVFILDSMGDLNAYHILITYITPVIFLLFVQPLRSLANTIIYIDAKQNAKKEGLL